MDRKSIIILAFCFVAYFSLQWVVNKIYPPKPVPHVATNSIASTLSDTNQPGQPSPPPEMSAAPAVSTPAIRNTSIPEEFVEVTNDYAHYTFTSYGGGLKLV